MVDFGKKFHSQDIERYLVVGVLTALALIFLAIGIEKAARIRIRLTCRNSDWRGIRNLLPASTRGRRTRMILDSLMIF